jgi:hypothetical protein
MWELQPSPLEERVDRSRRLLQSITRRGRAFARRRVTGTQGAQPATARLPPPRLREARRRARDFLPCCLGRRGGGHPAPAGSPPRRAFGWRRRSQGAYMQVDVWATRGPLQGKLLSARKIRPH